MQNIIPEANIEMSSGASNTFKFQTNRGTQQKERKRHLQYIQAYIFCAQSEGIIRYWSFKSWEMEGRYRVDIDNVEYLQPFLQCMGIRHSSLRLQRCPLGESSLPERLLLPPSLIHCAAGSHAHQRSLAWLWKLIHYDSSLRLLMVSSLSLSLMLVSVP